MNSRNFRFAVVVDAEIVTRHMTEDAAKKEASRMGRPDRKVEIITGDFNGGTWRTLPTAAHDLSTLKATLVKTRKEHNTVGTEETFAAYGLAIDAFRIAEDDEATKEHSRRMACHGTGVKCCSFSHAVNA